MKLISIVKDGNGLGLPCVSHVEGIAATEERGVKSPVPPGQGKQLEPTWEDKGMPPTCHVDGLLQPGA